MHVPTINLLPRETLAARARRRWIHRWMIAVGGSLVALGVAVVCDTLPGMTGHDVIAQRLEDVRARMRGLDRELPQAQKELDAVMTRMHAAERVQVRPDWGALLAYLDRLRGDDVALDRVSVSSTPGGRMVLRLSGLSGEQGHEGALVLGMERSGLFEKTTLVKTQRVNVQGGERIAFEVEGVFASGDLAEAPTP
ncbi:MAG: hypothetical protein R3B57_07670 [Phycisphaerales bacterium]